MVGSSSPSASWSSRRLVEFGERRPDRGNGHQPHHPAAAVLLDQSRKPWFHIRSLRTVRSRLSSSTSMSGSRSHLVITKVTGFSTMSIRLIIAVNACCRPIRPSRLPSIHWRTDAVDDRDQRVGRLDPVVEIPPERRAGSAAGSTACPHSRVDQLEHRVQGAGPAPGRTSKPYLRVSAVAVPAGQSRPGSSTSVNQWLSSATCSRGAARN